MPRPKKSLPTKKSDLIGFRDADLQERLDALVAANPGITQTEILRAALKDKLASLERGEPLIYLTIPAAAKRRRDPQRPQRMDLGPAKKSPATGTAHG